MHASPPLLDARGATLLLRGTNVGASAKSLPDRRARLDPSALRGLHDDVGLNAVRLLVFWDALEPTRGAYDDAYVAHVRDQVEAAASAGMHVLVDLHQDAYGAPFGYAGFPRWTCDPATSAGFHKPARWLESYLHPAVQQAFDAFWSSDALQASYADACAVLARGLRGTSVFAIDLVNEPHWGTLVPADFEARVLAPAYARWIDAVRSELPDVRCALAPAPTASLGLPTALTRPARDALLYAPHVYPPALELGGVYDGDPSAVRATVAQVTRDAQRLGMPLVVGELGARLGVPGAADYLRDAFDALDAVGASAFQWELGGEYALRDERGAWTPLAEALARATPRRVAGRDAVFAWDRAERTFELSWRDTDVGETRIALPRLAFPRGARVSIDGERARDVDVPELVVAPAPGERRVRVTARD